MKCSLLGMKTLLISVLVLHSVSPCPDPCECKWLHGQHTADCTEKNITQVPIAMDTTMQAIILDKNDITYFAEFEFYNANWANVRKISLKFCHLTSFNGEVFSGLSNLHHLDFSHNFLTSLKSSQFPTLPELRVLDLSDNLITNIHRDSFLGIGDNLIHIDLSGNKLTFLPWTALSYLPSLKQINMEMNPWNCDCHLGRLYSELTTRNISPGDPACSGNLACSPTVFLPLHQAVLLGQDVSLHCQVEGYPTPFVTWSKDGQPIVHDIRVTNSDNGIISILSITNITTTSLGLYSCLASNKEGTDKKELLLDFLKSDIHIVESDDHSLLIVIIISVIITSISIVSMFLISLCCKRRFQKRKTSSCKSRSFQSATNNPYSGHKSGSYGQILSQDISGTSSTQSYLLSETREENMSDVSGDVVNNRTLDLIDESLYEEANLSICPSTSMNKHISSRTSIRSSSTLSESVYSTARRAPYPRPGYVTLPRRPKQRPALLLDDGLGPRTSADGSSHSNISQLQGSSISAINTIGLPLPSNHADTSMPMRTSTPNTSLASEYSTTTSTSLLLPIPEQE